MNATRWVMVGALLWAMPVHGAESLEELAERAAAAHRQRNIGDASGLYGRMLQLEPPALPTDAQRELALKLAPRLHAVAGEFFPLKDIVAILHPDRPVIAYHLFWDDDIAYPADNEPCDHEIVWVEYDPGTHSVTRVSTYFHGHVVGAAVAVEDANAHGGRPWIGVEWGFHGSVPWRAESEPVVDEILRKHWQFAHERTLPEHPLARGWPRAFAGDYAAYLAFADANDPRPLLRERELIYVSRWATATINRRCLRYNFAAKTEWPWLGPK